MTRHVDSEKKQQIARPSERKSEKFVEARNSLPEKQRGVYDRLVDEYHFATVQRYGTGYVAYPVLAELVRSGWRPTADSLGELEEGSNSRDCRSRTCTQKMGLLALCLKLRFACSAPVPAPLGPERGERRLEDAHCC